VIVIAGHLPSSQPSPGTGTGTWNITRRLSGCCLLRVPSPILLCTVFGREARSVTQNPYRTVRTP
jgi:hypothetical protein